MRGIFAEAELGLGNSTDQRPTLQKIAIELRRMDAIDREERARLVLDMRAVVQQWIAEDRE